MISIKEHAIKAIDSANKLGEIASDAVLTKPSSSDRLAIALFRISLDHARAILFILAHEGQDLGAPAFALARPMYETFLRGAWFMFCGDDKAVQYFSDEDKFPVSALKDITAQVENVLDAAKYPTEAKIFSKVLALANTLHSFTHGGAKIVGPYLAGDGVGCSFEDGDVCELVDFAESTAYYVVTYMVELQGRYDVPLAKDMARRLGEYFQMD